MPQGGIDKNETPFDAMKRELAEETSVTNIKVIKEIENWLEYGLIVSTFMLLFPPNGVDMKTVTAMSILLAWAELLFLVGNHPWVSIYRTMFTRVSSNFFKFLLWLFWFVFSLGLAFSFLLHYLYFSRENQH